VTILYEGIGDKFQRETKYSRERLLGGKLEWATKPDAYKNYPSAEVVRLPQKLPGKSFDIIETLKIRRSVRSYSPEPLTLVDLSFLLWASTGVQRKERGFVFRTAPSAGALYPIETYLVANNVSKLEKALYHYDLEGHALEKLEGGDFTKKIGQAALEQKTCMEASVVFVWTAIFERSKWKYAQRAYRYIYLDAGHIAQNLALAAASIGLGSCQIGAFFDEEINQILGVDGEHESTIYLSAVGHPKRKITALQQ
jgi:SagB-type dehydrogenase family enzyme